MQIQSSFNVQVWRSQDPLTTTHTVCFGVHGLHPHVLVLQVLLGVPYYHSLLGDVLRVRLLLNTIFPFVFMHSHSLSKMMLLTGSVKIHLSWPCVSFSLPSPSPPWLLVTHPENCTDGIIPLLTLHLFSHEALTWNTHSFHVMFQHHQNSSHEALRSPVL